ncbi:choice-of-anchor D domain-containing protein [candidate division KSB1 bacterium]|nr:choice-of-anchor D domain-containing protein [candidate division KSB1 bacterium]
MKIQAQFIIAGIIVAIASSQGQTLQIISTEKKASESQSAALNRISVQPLCHNFCDVPVDSMRSALFKITSTGDSSFVFRGVTIRKDCWLDSCKLDSCKLRLDSPKRILQDTFAVTYIPATLSILAEFVPTDTVEYCASIAIISNATDGDSIFTYIGRGVAAVPKFSTTFYDFGEVLTGDTARWNFAIKNTGRYILKINRMALSNNLAYKIWPDTAHIKAGDSMTFQVSFFPQQAKDYPDTLRISKNSRFGDSVLILNGRGIQKPIAFLSDSIHDFGKVAIGDSLPWCFTIKNKGNRPLDIKDISVSQEAIFSIAPRSGMVSPENSMTICVTYTPKDTIPYGDNLHVHSNADTADSVIVLKGIGCAPGLVTAKPDTLNFGEVGVGRIGVHSLRVPNKGCDTLRIDSVRVKPDTIFTAQARQKIAPPDSNLIIDIKFTPKALKDYSAILSIASNAWKMPILKVPLRGRGVDVEPPLIAHAPPCSVSFNETLTLAFAVRDTFTKVPSCTLYYWQGGDSVYKLIDCTGRASVALPGHMVTERGVDYYFVASDSSGNHSRLPKSSGDHYSLSVMLNDSVLTRVDSSGRQASQPTGDRQNAYRLFSIPLWLNNSKPEDVFRNYFGPYDMGITWRLFDYHNGSYYELGENNFRGFEPGRAFWLIVNKSHKPIKVGAGKTVRTSDYADAVCGETKNFRKIKLEPGWNLFGVPFNFSVPLDSLRFSGNAEHLKEQIWIYQGDGWRNKPPALWPWEGYAIRSDSVHTMEIRPTIPQRTSSTSHSAFTKETGGDGWSIRIEARCDRTADLDNFAGVRPEAADDWDVYDLYEPPPIGDYVAVYFPHQDWADKSGDFAGDFRTPFPEGAVWEFEVKTNLKNELTTLRFENLVAVPDQFAIHLFDKNHQILKDLRKNGHYTYKELGELLPGRFELIVGTAAFTQGRTTTLQDLPNEFQLHPNYPNPFNNETILSFSLPQAAPVWLKIFDIMGRQVSVLSDGRVWGKGRHYLQWEGDDQNGVKIGSGVYILSLQAGDFKMQRRITLVK